MSRIFEPEWDDVPEWRKFHNDYDFQSSRNIIKVNKSRRMR